MARLNVNGKVVEVGVPNMAVSRVTAGRCTPRPSGPVGIVALRISGKEKIMVFCLFCHWTKVEPGTNCPNCNTYMPKASSAPRGTYPGRLRRPSPSRRLDPSASGLMTTANSPRRGHHRQEAPAASDHE
jgi:hypothetical protein